MNDFLFGQGLKCYQCYSLNDTSCANPSSSHIQDCSALINSTTQTPSSTTPSSTTPSSTTPSSTTPSSTTPSSTTPSSTTPSSISDKSEPNGKKDVALNDLNSITYAEEITFSCFTGHLTVQNGTMVENVIIRGCTPKTFSCLDESIINVDKEIRSCNIEFCQTDQCNSSDMVKMGMISLLLPLITILLRWYEDLRLIRMFQQSEKFSLHIQER
ncbi:hypothetical protein HZH68_000854 [Vespula germanica]|uniref:Uncharacterized protein n=1 Tax=Vespula germanica TaxID=30212 RepID=A0A834U687_VESGE|nr:hypothetical protein HZH68_000854 [Vespula germanica]